MLSAVRSQLIRPMHIPLRRMVYAFAPSMSLLLTFSAHTTVTMIFHRNKVAAEILSTEQTYVHNLKILTGVRSFLIN